MHHVMCRNIESLPRSIQPKPTPKEHGIVSDYEPLLSKSKEPIEAICINHKHPKPVDKTIFDALLIPDPQLNLTPEKTLNKNQIKSTIEERTVKSKPKVKFNIPNNETDIRTIDTISNGDVISIIPKQDSLWKQCIQSAACSSSQPSKLASTSSRWKPFAGQMQPLDLYACSSDALARPEFNSTLRVARDILKVRSAELNVKMVAKEKLENSESLREKLGEKASENVNIKGNCFHNIFPIEFSPNRVVDREEEEKRELAKEAHRTIKPREKDPEPDLFELFTEDLHPEFLNMSVSVSRPTIKPETAPLESAFDIYRYLHL